MIRIQFFVLDPRFDTGCLLYKSYRIWNNILWQFGWWLFQFGIIMVLLLLQGKVMCIWPQPLPMQNPLRGIVLLQWCCSFCICVSCGCMSYFAHVHMMVQWCQILTKLYGLVWWKYIVRYSVLLCFSQHLLAFGYYLFKCDVNWYEVISMFLCASSFGSTL